MPVRLSLNTYSAYLCGVPTSFEKNHSTPQHPKRNKPVSQAFLHSLSPRFLGLAPRCNGSNKLAASSEISVPKLVRLRAVGSLRRSQSARRFVQQFIQFTRGLQTQHIVVSADWLTIDKYLRDSSPA
jgi:hypothetical protein